MSEFYDFGFVFILERGLYPELPAFIDGFCTQGGATLESLYILKSV